MTPAELAVLVDRELAALPRPKAPASLLPRILAAVEHRAREPWHRLPWHAWPVKLQLASGGLLAALAWLADSAWRAIEVAADPEMLVATNALWRLVVKPAATNLAACGAVMIVVTAMFCMVLTLMLREGGPNHEAH